ncbi:MAG: alpha/beta fold hydrolase [Candidatus Accumulibacter sp.]|jgi:pimeloyl-ACP methyl ester carboxylesterase|nr:alpha/beta fold hydrolase [Accumulibacter sp.]
MEIPRKWLVPEKPPRLSWARWLFGRFVVVFCLVTAILLGAGIVFKNRFAFHPDREILITPKDLKLDYEEAWLKTPDGLRMKAWRILPPSGAAGRTSRTVLVFHGNGGNMSHFSQWEELHSLGLTVMTIDYPGYGMSEGAPTEERTYQAAEALWRWALERGAAPGEIVLYGFSLGGGVASRLALDHPPAALVLDSSFTRLRDVPATHTPALSPLLRLILGNAFDTKTRLETIRCPLLVLHSPEDRVVPFVLGKEVFESYRNNRKEMVVGTGGHQDFSQNRALYLKKIRDFLNELPKPNSAASQTSGSRAGAMESPP